MFTFIVKIISRDFLTLKIHGILFLNSFFLFQMWFFADMIVLVPHACSATEDQKLS